MYNVIVNCSCYRCFKSAVASPHVAGKQRIITIIIVNLMGTKYFGPVIVDLRCYSEYLLNNFNFTIAVKSKNKPFVTCQFCVILIYAKSSKAYFCVAKMVLR